MLIFGYNLNSYVDVLWWLFNYPTGPDNTPKRSSENTHPTSSPITAVPVNHTPPPFFALIIGINQYEDDETRNLKGCVADADSVQRYLEDSLKVEKSHIRNLRCAQATRERIISELKALETNPQIKKGDPILIYYAGHGGEAPSPAGWEAGGADSKTQMLIPQNYNGRTVHGIPDRTMSALLENLAWAKGDNITVIFDCCYSASGTRTDKVNPNQSVRGTSVTTPAPGLDAGILNAGRGARVRPGFLLKGLRSHVLLAACGAKERAKEDEGRGAFTKALLQALSTVSADTITYTGLLQRIHALPQQHPQCEGINQGRILFNAKAPSIGRELYKVSRKGAKYILEAGSAHGISKGTEFAVCRERDTQQKASFLGTLIVKEVNDVDAFTTTLHLPDGASELALSGAGYALQTRTGEEEDLRLHIELNDALCPIFEAFAREMLRTDPTHWRVQLVEKEKAELALSLDRNKAVFDILNPQVTRFGLTRHPFRIEPTYDAVFPVIRAAAHYHWHLRRSNTNPLLQNLVDVEFRKVEELGFDDDLNSVIKPVGDNLNVDGVINLIVDPEVDYGIKVINRSPVDLYASLFFFDNSDLSITSYYQPPTASSGLDVPLSKKIPNGPPGSLTIGYGSGGEVPYNYFMPDKQNVDIGFLKLFLTSRPADYSNIPQLSPFDLKNRSMSRKKVKPPLIWDTILIQVVQRRA